MLAAATCHPNLRSLSLTTGEPWINMPSKCTAAHLEKILTACPNLTRLDLSTSTLDSQALDYLLDNDTSLESLAVFDIHINSSRAHKRWGLKELRLTKAHRSDSWSSVPDYPGTPSVIHLAYLPLRIVATLQLWSDIGDCLSLLELPSDTVHPDLLPIILAEAAANLAACPAWQVCAGLGGGAA
jgi:hypothetical protein